MWSVYPWAPRDYWKPRIKLNGFIYIYFLRVTIKWGSCQGSQCLVSASKMASLCPSSRGTRRMGKLVMSDVISIFWTISEACAKTRHYCCNAPSRELPADSKLLGKHHATNNIFLNCIVSRIIGEATWGLMQRMLFRRLAKKCQIYN